MTTKEAKIRAQIEKLSRDLEAAERETEKKNEAKILKAARKAGLVQTGLSAARLESEFRAISKKDTDQEAAQAETCSGSVQTSGVSHYASESEQTPRDHAGWNHAQR